MQLKAKIKLFTAVALAIFLILPPSVVFASTPVAGGDTTVVSPLDDGAVSINEDAVQPETSNIRLIVPTLVDPTGGTPSNIRILSVTGGTLWQSNGSSIGLGASGSILGLSTGKIDFRFRPDAGRDTNASFQYVVVDPHENTVNSSASTATITINAVNDAPVMQTATGGTGIGLAATYYINAWDLTGSTYRRIDSSINFSNNFGVPGLNAENFSVRWTGKVKAPVTGNITFSTSSDDGVRLWVEDVLVIDNWTLHGETVDTATPIAMEADTLYSIRMEFYERGGGEVAKLRWAYTGQATQIIPQAYLYPAVTRPTLNFVNGSGAVVIDDAITISDVDSANITGGTVEITANYEDEEDALQFTNQNGITGVFDNGVLTLSGTTTVANYQAALRTVRYFNSSGSPTTNTRTIEFTVTDGTDESNPTYRDIGFTGVNSVPVITEGATTAVTMDEDSAPTAFSLTLNATDADYHSITWSVSSAASHGTATASGSGDSIAVTYIPTANYYGSDSFVVQASDGLGSDTITVNVTIRDKTAPILSAVAVSSITSTSAVVTWTSDENTSTRVSYGVTSAYGVLSSQTDTSPRVTSHSKTLTELLPCTRYHFAVISVDDNTNSTTSSDGTFVTIGCEAETEAVSVSADSIEAADGGEVEMVSGNTEIRVVLPTNFTNAAGTVVIQVKSIEGATVWESLGRPDIAPREIGAVVFDVKAIINNTTVLDSFDAPVTIEYQYADDDVEGINLTTLWLYHYHDDAWQALDDCEIDTGTNSITCTTDGFSVFALFGQVNSNGAGGPPPTGIPLAGTAHPAGTLVLDNGTVYLMSQSGRLGFRNEQEYLSHGFKFEHIVPANSGDLAKPLTGILKAMEGTLVLDAADSTTVYMIGLSGTKRGFESPAIFHALGYTFKDLARINLSDYPAGPVILEGDEVHPEGALVLEGLTVWWVQNNIRHGFESEAVYQTYGFNFSRLVPATAADLSLPEGELVRFRDGTLVEDLNNFYIISNGKKLIFANDNSFNWFEYKKANVIKENLVRYELGSGI